MGYTTTETFQIHGGISKAYSARLSNGVRGVILLISTSYGGTLSLDAPDRISDGDEPIST